MIVNYNSNLVYVTVFFISSIHSGNHYYNNYGYQFAFQEIEGGVECPWTYEKRFNIFSAEYTTDYKQGANDYKIYAVSDEVNGVFPGTPMKSK